MSIFSKLAIIFVCFALLSFNPIKASEASYNPISVDTFLVQNAQQTEINEHIQSLSDTVLGKIQVWDIQNLKTDLKSPAIIWVFPLMLILWLIIKNYFKIFYNNILPGISSARSFQLSYQNKMYSDLLPLLILFLIRNMGFVVVVQFLMTAVTGSLRYLSTSVFLLGFILMTIFYIMTYFLEYIVQNAIGYSGRFRMYITQYLLITTWVVFPIIIILLIINLNKIDIRPIYLIMLVMFPLIITASFAIFRSIFARNEWRGGNLIYFFMYLCTFKLFPYLILVKYLKGILM